MYTVYRRRERILRLLCSSPLRLASLVAHIYGSWRQPHEQLAHLLLLRNSSGTELLVGLLRRCRCRLLPLNVSGLQGISKDQLLLKYYSSILITRPNILTYLNTVLIISMDVCVGVQVLMIRLRPEPEFPAGTGPRTRIPVLMSRNSNLFLKIRFRLSRNRNCIWKFRFRLKETELWCRNFNQN